VPLPCRPGIVATCPIRAYTLSHRAEQVTQKRVKNLFHSFRSAGRPAAAGKWRCCAARIGANREQSGFVGHVVIAAAAP
jgi:hypothetical protein